MDKPGYYSHAGRKPGSGANWPLWVVLGVFVAGIIGVICMLAGESRPPASLISPGPARTVEAPVEVDMDCMTLEVGCWYSVSAETPLCAECGQKPADDNATTGTSLPAHSQFGIMKVASTEGARWYYVQAAGSDGRTKLGTGWISAESLKSQSIRFVK